MSAIGGSMFPRFLMSETMQKVGLLAADVQRVGTRRLPQVFWRNAPTWQLRPQLLVLGGLTIVFLSLARVFARRWEIA